MCILEWVTSHTHVYLDYLRRKPVSQSVVLAQIATCILSMWHFKVPAWWRTTDTGQHELVVYTTLVHFTTRPHRVPPSVAAMVVALSAAPRLWSWELAGTHLWCGLVVHILEGHLCCAFLSLFRQSCSTSMRFRVSTTRRMQRVFNHRNGCLREDRHRWSSTKRGATVADDCKIRCVFRSRLHASGLMTTRSWFRNIVNHPKHQWEVIFSRRIFCDGEALDRFQNTASSNSPEAWGVLTLRLDPQGASRRPHVRLVLLRGTR